MARRRTEVVAIAESGPRQGSPLLLSKVGPQAALRRGNKREIKMTTPRHIRVFLSSPGDVSEERLLARKVIKKELPYDPFLRDRVTLEIVSWDDPSSPTPMLASLTPQEAVDRGLPKPSECDFVVVILWGRFGSPLPDSVRKPGGERYLSGTEWEYEDAISAKRQPEILIYRRTEKVLLDADDPEYLSKLEQRKRVNEFFERFRNPDGSYKGGVNAYDIPRSFAERLKSDLRTLLAAKFGGARTAAGHTPPPRSFQSNIPARRLPFIGREKLLNGIHKLLGDPSQGNVIVLRGQAGVGKSELAREFARRHCDQYPGGTFFINGRTEAVALDLAQFGRTWLGLDLPSDFRLEDQALRTLRALGDAPSLLLFDNVLAEDAIRPWLPPGGMPCHAVITSLVDCWDAGWTVIPVEPLSDSATLKLIE